MASGSVTPRQMFRVIRNGRDIHLENEPEEYWPKMVLKFNDSPHGVSPSVTGINIRASSDTVHAQVLSTRIRFLTLKAGLFHLESDDLRSETIVGLGVSVDAPPGYELQ